MLAQKRQQDQYNESEKAQNLRKRHWVFSKDLDSDGAQKAHQYYHQQNAQYSGNDAEALILGDRQTPYSVLRKVMATCTEAEYGKVSLAVVESELRQSTPVSQRTAQLIR